MGKKEDGGFGFGGVRLKGSVREQKDVENFLKWPIIYNVLRNNKHLRVVCVYSSNLKIIIIFVKRKM